MPPLRYVIVGLGNIGQKRRAWLGPQCVATVDPNVAAADYSSLEACPAEAYDAAILAVPNQPKLRLLEQCLRAGKSVLVDKPLLFGSSKECADLLALASTRGAVWVTAYNHRFEPALQKLKEVLNQGTLGPLYHARLLYGNGTVRHIRGTWREHGSGVIEDLGSHLIDLVMWLFEANNLSLRAVATQRCESTAIDRACLASSDGRFLLECSYLAWKNTFGIEVFGQHGSAHVDGLQKWGQAQVTVRRRVLPSGAPTETSYRFAGPDESFRAELEQFERRVLSADSSAQNDAQISAILRELVFE